MKSILWSVFAILTVLTAEAQIAPSIVSISSSRQANQGQSVSLIVAADGSAPLSYQWKKGGLAIAGATSSTFSIASVALADSGSYTVSVSNSSGSVVGGPILLDVVAAVAPSIYYQSSNVTITAGDSFGLNAYVSGTAPLQYIWKKDNVVVKTATDDYQYYKGSATSADAGTYTVTVSNVAGSATSSAITVTVNALTAPVFNTQPNDATIPYGGSAYLYSGVTNSNGVTYQWYKDDAAIAGATSSYYYPTLAGTYKVIATNSVGSTTSKNAVVTVLPPVAPNSLSISPMQIKVVIGDYFSLYASVSGSLPMVYQWRKDGKDIPGANSYYYSKSNAKVDDTGNYSVVVSNVAGSATSASAFVSIASPLGPVITQQPASVTLYPGDNLSLGVSATGTGSLRYQWRKDGVAITGATSSYFYPGNSISSADAGTYTVVVSNDYGAVVSSAATVTVLAATAPVITAQPSNLSVVTGQTISLSVSATGHPSPTYQWKKDGTSIPNATSNSYYKSSAAADDAGSYTVVVTNSAGSATSSAAVVQVISASAPVITSHPASFSVPVGYSAYDLSVGFYNSNSSGNITIDWYKNDVLIPNAHSSSYYISNAQPDHAGIYKAKLTNSAGTVTSIGAVVTVDLSSARPVIIYTSGSRAIAPGAGTYVEIGVNSSVLGYKVQWKKDGVVVPNAFANSLSVPNFDESAEGTYTAEVTTATGTYTSQPIVLSLLESGSAPRIMRQPAAARRSAGTSVNFNVEVDSISSATYQWRKDGVDIPGAGGSYWSSFSIYAVKASDAGSYSVVVSNEAGSVTSDAAVLTVDEVSVAPIFATQPASQVLTGNNPYFSLGVSLVNPTPSDKYQWYKDGTPILGATSSSYYYYSGSLEPRLAGTYKVAVTNAIGTSTSANAVITVQTPLVAPSFSAQLSNRIGRSGGAISFTAAATGTPTITYQWRKDGVAIQGATGSTLTLTNLQASDEGSYSVLATNGGGTTVSSAAKLTVVTDSQRSIWLMNGTSFAGQADVGSFNVSWEMAAVADFNGDGNPDILWQNVTTGERYLWFMSGTVHYGDASLGIVPPNWEIAAVADFNHDGRPDILWVNRVTGSLYLWYMNGALHFGDADLGIAPLHSVVAAAADFNGDGQVDLLWQNTTTGERFVWLMQGELHVGDVSLGVVDTAWTIATAADFNGDSKADIFWQNTATGQQYLWLMNGVVHIGDIDYGVGPTDRILAGAADFNADGKIDLLWQDPAVRTIGSDFNRDGVPDILWQNLVTGERYLWLMNSTGHWGDAPLDTMGVAWSIAATADFNSDGEPDLLWENTTTGACNVWYMHGAIHSGGADLGQVGGNWAIAAAADLNGDGKPDILWRNKTTGALYLWLMDGTTHYGDVDLGSASVNQVVAAIADFDGDGKVDVLWSNTVTGERFVWFMDDAVHDSDAPLVTVSTDWVIAAAEDFNRDGKPDILWQNTTTGERYIWLMDGLVHTGDINLGVVSPNWSIVK